jgi:hypothetical protein
MTMIRGLPSQQTENGSCPQYRDFHGNAAAGKTAKYFTGPDEVLS